MAATAALALLPAAPALGAVGDLGFVEVHAADQGMDHARGVVVSHDGRNVYVAGGVAGIATYARNQADGKLTYVGCIEAPGGPATCSEQAQGAGGTQYVAVSPDGKHVYSAGSGTVAVLNRDQGDGHLTANSCWRDDGSGVGCGANVAPRLGGSEGIAVSPDGANVYVASQGESSVSTFSRDAGTGALTYLSCFSTSGCDTPAYGGDFSAPRALTVAPDGKGVYVGVANSGVVAMLRDTTTGLLTYADTVSELDPALIVGVAVAPDNKHVYAGSVNRNAVYAMSRNPATAELSLLGCVEDTDYAGTCGQKGQGLEGAEGVAVAGDGASVYTSGLYGYSLAVLSRDPSGGLLTHSACFRANNMPAGPCSLVAGLQSARDVAVSRDAKSVYITGQVSDSITVFSREAVPGFDPDAVPPGGGGGGGGGTPTGPPPGGPPGGAPATPVKPTLPKAEKLVKGFPSTKRCLSRRKFSIRLAVPTGVTVSKATVFVSGKRVVVRRGKKLLSAIDLKGLPKGRYTVKIEIVTSDGTKLKATRKYRTCTKKAKKRRAAR